MAIRTAAFSTIAGLLIVAGMLRWRSWIKAPLDETRYLAVALTTFGTAVLLNVPPVVSLLDRRILHVTDGSILVSHLLGLVTAWGGIELCTEVSGHGPRHRGVRLAVLIVVSVALVVTFFGARPRIETALFFEQYARAIQLRAYWMLLVGSLVAATLYLAHVALRHTRHDERWLRRGLQLIGAGATLISVFALSRLVAMWIDLPAWVESMAILLLSIGAAILAIGALLPHIATACRRRAARHSLRPVWVEVTARYPHVRANSQPRTLYRLIIEIQDAIAEARSRNELESPLVQALDRLPPHTSDDLDGAVDDLLAVAHARSDRRRTA